MAGRPKLVFTDDIKAQIEQMASNNCRDNTIAGALDIPRMSFKRHFGKICAKKRQEFRNNLRSYQHNLAKSNPAMAIFLGKNELDQTDRQVIEHEDTERQKQLNQEENAKVDRFLAFDRQQSIKPHKDTG